jgi:hypothetical protein
MTALLKFKSTFKSLKSVFMSNNYNLLKFPVKGDSFDLSIKYQVSFPSREKKLFRVNFH